VLSFQAFHAAQRRTMQWLRIGVILALVLPAVFFAAIAAYRHEQIEAEHRRNAQRLARIVSEHASKLFDTNEVLLDRLLDLAGNEPAAALREREVNLHARVRGMVQGLPQVQSVWIIDESGHPVVTNRFLPAPFDLDLSDREAFRSHRDGNRRVFVTGALLGRRTKEVFFELTKRREFPDGGFAGTVQVSLYPKYLVDFYRDLASNEIDLTITLTRDDGSLIARWPATVEPGYKLAATSPLLAPMREKLDAGIHLSRSTIDGVERLSAFRKVGDYPVYAYAGISTTSIRSIWQREMLLLAAFTFPIALSLALAGWIALRKTRRGLDMARRLHDETLQRQKVEELLRHTQKMEALGHLTGGVAHDFNNLLMIVDMNAQLLRRTVPALAGDQRLDAIAHAVANGTRLTRQLLSFSRRQPLVPRTIDLAVMLSGLAELCRPVLGSRVEVALDVAPGLPAVHIDVSELELALINLAVNSRHAMPSGGRFSITARQVADGGVAWIEIAVADTGSGIPADILERVFEPFFTTKASEGTGLGLSQVYGMCNAAGGSARIDSAPGAGTTVTLRLPPADGRLDRPTDIHPVDETPLGLRVLLVEDNAEIRRAARHALHFVGCEVEHCDSADQALDFLAHEHGRIDFILSDVVMPGRRDGIELAREVRRRYPRIRMALMTGYAEKLADAQALGVQVFPKPFDIDALRALLADRAVH